MQRVVGEGERGGRKHQHTGRAYPERRPAHHAPPGRRSARPEGRGVGWAGCAGQGQRAADLCRVKADGEGGGGKRGGDFLGHRAARRRRSGRPSRRSG